MNNKMKSNEGILYATKADSFHSKWRRTAEKWFWPHFREYEQSEHAGVKKENTEFLFRFRSHSTELLAFKCVSKTAQNMRPTLDSKNEFSFQFCLLFDGDEWFFASIFIWANEFNKTAIFQSIWNLKQSEREIQEKGQHQVVVCCRIYR